MVQFKSDLAEWKTRTQAGFRYEDRRYHHSVALICVGTRGSGPTANGVMVARGFASYEEARSTQRQDRIGIGMGDIVQMTLQ